MGDHFGSTLKAIITGTNSFNQSEHVTINDTMNYSISPRKVVECRICQDEDFDSNMESPCSCCGSLKYAHRKCVQRWCNEKGDTLCEICHQQFKPGYTAPSPILRFGGLPMNLRGNWRIARMNLNDPRIIAMVSTDDSFLDPEYDELAVSTSRSILCCRSVAIIFMVLLILRHTIPAIVSEAGNYSFPLIMLLMLRVIGIIVPICIILKAAISALRRRHQQANLSVSPSDEESGPLILHQ